MSDARLEYLSTLSGIIDLMRSKGVRSYKGMTTLDGHTPFNLELELEPTIVDHPDAKPVPDPDRCACGHMAHEHSNGLCLHGCEPEACAPPEDPK